MNVYKKGLVAAVASTMVFAGAAGAPAFAQPSSSAPTPAASFAGTPTIPSDWETGNLYIHKFENANPSDKSGDGSEIKDTSTLGRPMEGVTYTINRLDGLNVRSNADWRTFAGLNGLNEQLPAGVTATKVKDVQTGANGLASVTDLPLGFYQVVETVPEGYTAKSNPFYVSVPMTNPQNRTSWMQDVHVYPKNEGPNQTSQPVKTVVDANKHAGEIIKYPVTQTLPNTADTRANGFAYYAIRDVVPQERLELPTGNNAASAVEFVKVGGTPLAAGTDYFVQLDNDGNPVVTFSKARVEQLKAGDKVEVNFQFKVKAVAGNELGAVENKLQTYPVPGNATNPPTPPTDTPPGDTPWEPPTDTPPDTPDHNPNSYFGNAFLTKKDAASKAAIKGAEFSVYGGACSTVGTNTQALKTAITDANGRADFLGLHVNNFENDKAVGETQETPKSYCLVETKAADGYELLAQPIDFKVVVEGQDGDGIGGTVKAVNLTTDQNLTDNTRLNLPLTGGNGIWFVLAIGAILVAAGGAYSYAQRRNA